MPELPDVTIYIERLQARLAGQPLQRVRLASPFLLRSVAPPLEAAAGRRVVGFRRLGKRIVFELEDELFLVVHLMIAGRFHWKAAGAKVRLAENAYGAARAIASHDVAVYRTNGRRVSAR